MKNVLCLVAGLVLATGVCVHSAQAELKVGDPAPEFELQGSDGQTYRLSDLKLVALGVPRKPAITTRKEEDKVSAHVKGDIVTYAVTSPSGIGGASITPGNGWPKRIVLRLNLSGLESLAISNGKVDLRASVLSHSGHPRLLSLKAGDGETKVERDSPYWTRIEAFDATGKPVTGLPGKGGYFEIELPAAIFAAKPKSLTMAWIDFYRN